ncbi:50S ribosomal protein L25 [Synoicihabitans lomoniglobus]|uniref:Large ribosomal subunit protein bL25 n=1 Tax=Synoicihabitans lomoniglobus TaxID=2909285 RepID=A0AAF0CQ60_9BACT|nr:50S ribosomal protein L25 [Opitutaceae bacterium LMO-M01]WED66025.1 50S ribosomal protein L25 [Opitutaceae bacterium LMO-M01]
MSTTTTLQVSAREQTGRSASRRLRKSNQIPAILYGKHSEPTKLTIDAPAFRKLLKKISGRKTIIELTREGADKPALSFLQEVQRDPITDIYLHADFQEIHAGEAFEVEVPVVVRGECVGVKTEGGVLEMASPTVRVRCLPKDLPGAIEVDITNLHADSTIKIGGLPVIEGVEYRDPVGQVVVGCTAGEEEEEAPADAAAAAKPAKK